MTSAPKAPPRPYAAPGHNIQDLIDIMARLRDPKGGCPWDVEQTFATIAPYTIEEAYEVADAIARDNMPALKDELGDLLFQVVFHARMAEESGLFAFPDVVGAISDKMIRRHPHVFGTAKFENVAAQTEAWENMKAAERAAAGEPGTPPSVLDGLPAGLPALKQAEKLQKRAARVGFDWTQAKDILGKIQEELDEVRAEFEAEAHSPERLTDEIGDLLFACVNLARKAGIDPGMALRGTNLKFDRRFRRVEALLCAAGKSPEGATLDEMENLWVQAKHEERAKT
ncbi:MAG: nucleoside triphosphate pyrophosphohydrolase [Rhodospirillaceae bacterium]|nr:nucleoside triphosphate pyrophosphohydrolase [Rhodospirillaceae bacterium]